MNYTNFINALSRELDKEMTKDGFEDKIRFAVQNIFDRAARTTLTRTIDKLTKIGPKKGV